jgi:hypothetical protein
MREYTIKLTRRRLEAISSSLSAHLAGEEGAGDLADISHKDLQAALDWCHQKMRRMGMTDAEA